MINYLALCHVQTFDLSGDILACLGQTEWHYFEPCLGYNIVRFGSVLHTLLKLKNKGGFFYYYKKNIDAEVLK